jgi:hypothetical protein
VLDVLGFAHVFGRLHHLLTQWSSCIPVGKEVDVRAERLHLAAAFEWRALVDLVPKVCLIFLIHHYRGGPRDIRAQNFIVEPERDEILLSKINVVCNQSSFKFITQGTMDKTRVTAGKGSFYQFMVSFMAVFFPSCSAGTLVTFAGSEFINPTAVQKGNPIYLT